MLVITNNNDILTTGQKTSSPTKSTSEVKSRRARNRWFVAITLMRNRALTINRVPILPELQQVQEESRDKTDHGLVKVSQGKVWIFYLSFC